MQVASGGLLAFRLQEDLGFLRSKQRAAIAVRCLFFNLSMLVCMSSYWLHHQVDQASLSGL